MDNQTRKISDAFPAAKEAFAFHREFERAEYFTLRERAYQLEDKIRFGLLALNAGSILAIVAAASKDGLAGALQLTPSELVVPIITLLGGVVTVGASLWLQRSSELLHAADAYKRVMAASSVQSSIEMPMTEETLAAHKALVEDYHAAPLVGFQWSKPVTWLQAISMGCWVGAVIGLVRNMIW